MDKIKTKNKISTEWYFLIKWIAIVCMMIDHLAIVFLDSGVITETLYFPMRMIGRVAFPLFVYEIVECFHFTKERGRHLIELGLLAVISEVPFDLVRHGTYETDKYLKQNIIFGLFACFLCLLVVDTIKRKRKNVFDSFGKLKKHITYSMILSTYFLFSIMLVLFKIDYDYKAILLVALFEFARNRKKMKTFQFIAILLFFCNADTYLSVIYLGIFGALIPIYLAENKVKIPEKIKKVLTIKKVKNIGTFVYPVHLLLFAILKFVLLLKKG